MHKIKRFAVCVIALFAVAGCASTKISDRKQYFSGKLPRPSQVWVYDFATTPDEVPGESAIAGQVSASSQTAEQAELGRKLGAQIAAELAERIRVMGMPAARASTAVRPQLNDLVIRGYLLSVDEGSAVKRMTIGFGSGGSELKTAVEAFQMTDRGLQKLGSGTLDSGGSKTPGAAVGAATFAATANPVGLIVSGGMKVYGEASGSSRIEGRAEQTAKEIATVLEERFRDQGWIE